MGSRDPNMVIPTGSVPPDQWDAKYGVTLPLTHVISRGNDGKVLSYVGDFVWNLTPYDPRGKRTALYFDYWTIARRKTINAAEITPQRESRIRELQFLMVLLVYHGKARTSGNTHLNNRLRGLLAMAKFSESRSCTVREVLESRVMLDSFIGTVSADSEIQIQILAWLNVLWSLEPDELGFVVPWPTRWAELLNSKRRMRANGKQHAPLPTRIYGALINNLAREMDDVDLHKDRLLGAFNEAIAEHRKTRALNAHLDIDFGPKIVKKYGLQDYLKLRGLSLGLMGLSGAVVDVFRICKLQIHVFSGMRCAEALHLPFHCMEAEKLLHGRHHCLITGITTKLEGARRRRTKWVTTRADGFRAVLLAQQFAGVLYKSVGLTPCESEKTKDDYPLFLSTVHLPWVSDASNSKVELTPARATLSTSAVLKTVLCSNIEDGDLAELEEIDPFRAWRSEPEYALGKPWPLKTHQLRRSLALYANASGLVRLSSLRRQLQHITREMSQYYGRGSAFAKNFLDEDSKGYKRHIVAEWQDGEQEAQSLAFVHDVLKSEEQLHGAAGKYYELQRKREEVLSVEELKKQIKLGRLAYRPSPLGGCTNPSTCESTKGLRLIDTTCATEGCKHLIGKHSKIIQTIRLQRATLSRMDPSSVTYQMEKEELSALEATERLWRPPNGQENGAARV